jgi:hypothetical protein
MERLTGIISYCSFTYCDNEGKCNIENVCYDKQLYEKLKNFEDLEEQGRLIKLPCKVGDTVYHECPYSTLLVGVQSYQITNIMISQNKKGEWTRKYRAMLLRNGKTADKQINFEFNDIGKTVFLTKEEAEKALEMEK